MSCPARFKEESPEANQHSVITGLQAQGTEGSVRMAKTVAGQR